MSISIDQSKVEAYLESLLAAFKDGKITALQARNDLAQSFTMAATDNETDLSPYAFVQLALGHRLMPTGPKGQKRPPRRNRQCHYGRKDRDWRD